MIEPFVKKAWLTSRGEGAQTIVLVPASVGANWWATLVHNKARVWFMNGRTRFSGHKDYYPKDTSLLLYGPKVIAGYEVWRWRDGVQVPKE